MRDELTVHCLASRSSGNSLLVTAGGAAILVDAGLTSKGVSARDLVQSA